MGNTSYAVTITNDHQLIVNDTPVAPPEGIHMGDSEALLAWALDRVSDAHAESDGTMVLAIQDQREQGYGVSETVLQEGEDITIEDVRRRTGRDLSVLSDPYDEYDRAAEEAELLAERDGLADQPEGEFEQDPIPDVLPEAEEELASEAESEDGPAVPEETFGTVESLATEEVEADPSEPEAVDADQGRDSDGLVDATDVEAPPVEADPVEATDESTVAEGVEPSAVEEADGTDDAVADEVELPAEPEVDVVDGEDADASAPEIVDGLPVEKTDLSADVERPADETSVVDAVEQTSVEVPEAEGAEDEPHTPTDGLDVEFTPLPDPVGEENEADPEDEPNFTGETVEDEPVEDATSDDAPDEAQPLPRRALTDEGVAASGSTRMGDDEIVRGPLPFKALDDPEDVDPTEAPKEEVGLFAPTPEERAAAEAAEEAERRAAEEAEIAEAERRAAEEAEAKRVEREKAEAEAEAERARVNAEIEEVARKNAEREKAEGAGDTKKTGLVGRLRGRGKTPREPKPKREPKAKRERKSTRPAKPPRVTPQQARAQAAREENMKSAQTLADQRGWTPYERPVPRPHIADAVIRQRRSRPWVWALVFLVLAGLLGYRYYMDNEATVYAAVCVDERTMTRQASDAACKDLTSPSYNRWLYVPRDGHVPGVGQAVDLTQGSFDPPSEDENAAVTYGFADDGGVVGANR